MLSLTTLVLSNTQVADEGVVRLTALKNLRNLWLLNTLVSDSAILELHASLPKCRIRRRENEPAHAVLRAT